MKYDEFLAYQKFSYRLISKPTQTFIESLRNTKFLFINPSQKSSYFKDIKFLIANEEHNIEQRLKLKSYLKLYKFSDIIILLYGIHSLVWHYRNKFFNTGSKFVDLYIVGKVALNMVLLAYGSLFIFKYMTDPIMYDYFSKKEREWDELLLSKQQDSLFTQQRRSVKDIINKNLH
jgi:hypothetical protein